MNVNISLTRISITSMHAICITYIMELIILLKLLHLLIVLRIAPAPSVDHVDFVSDLLVTMVTICFSFQPGKRESYDR